MTRFVPARRRSPLTFAIVIILAAAGGLSPVVAQDAEPGEEEGDAEESRPRDILQEQRDVLTFGITSEVVELLETLRERGDDRLVGDVVAMVENEAPYDIQRAAFDYFQAIETDEGFDAGVAQLSRREELPDRVVLSVLRYLSGRDESLPEDSLDGLVALSDSGDPEVSRQAIRLASRIDAPAADQFLVETAASLEEDQARREAAILALGDSGRRAGVEILTRILSDRAETESLRWYAADALGKIGEPSSVQPLQEQLQNADTWFRAYLIGALGRFEGAVEDDLFVRALRDDFWRVRVSALETLGRRRSTGAFEAMRYRARRDPVDDVRRAAFEALGALSNNEARRFLAEYAKDEANPPNHRATAVEILVRDYLMQSGSDVEALLGQLWSETASPVLISLVRSLSESGDAQAGPHLIRLLQHPDPGAQMRALMGLQRIGIARYRSEIERLAEESPYGAVRGRAEAALEEM